MVVRSTPTGRADSFGALSPDCATLHPGLFSSPPSGRDAGFDRLGRENEPVLATEFVHAIALIGIPSVCRTQAVFTQNAPMNSEGLSSSVARREFPPG